MNMKTWELLDRSFSQDLEVAGETITKALEVPDDNEVQSAAREIGCNFHDDYTAFLKRYGGAVVGSLPVFGLRPVEVMGEPWSVVKVTEWFREQGWLGVADWYVISEDGYGNPIGIAPDGKVMTNNNDFGGISIIADSFEDFLLQQLKA